MGLFRGSGQRLDRARALLPMIPYRTIGNLKPCCCNTALAGLFTGELLLPPPPLNPVLNALAKCTRAGMHRS